MKWLVFFLCLSILLSGVSQSVTRESETLYEESFNYYRNNELGLARTAIEDALSKHETPKARYLSGLIYEADDRGLRAVSEYEAAVKLDPEYREAIFKKALIYLKYGDPSQAVKDLSYLINTYSESHETTSILFQIDESGTNQNRILTTNMLEARLHYYRGQAFQKLDKVDMAINDFNSAISIEETPDYLIGRGLLYLDGNNSGFAVRDFKKAVSLDSTNHLAWYNLAISDENTAIPTSLVLGAEFAPTLSLLASKEIEKGNFERAKNYLDKALKIDPKDEFSLINRGRLLLKLGQYGKARSDFNAALRTNPQKIEALYLIGNAYFFEKDFNRSLAYYSQYLSVDGLNGMIWYNAAMCHFELENNQEGCHHLQMADQMGMTQARAMLQMHCE